ncbi:hypothetical protein NDU88_009451 [Pleurodeles waltl]|uniref:Uncharacterized protein n=1 Tax=Pleurodeles waltl TaxID=8319 RepID=A0AAV7P403_PLEWA|nr:hypothetical protein NDU88_009451 [Pleurodeles waltl]
MPRTSFQAPQQWYPLLSFAEFKKGSPAARARDRSWRMKVPFPRAPRLDIAPISRVLARERPAAEWGDPGARAAGSGQRAPLVSAVLSLRHFENKSEFSIPVPSELWTMNWSTESVQSLVPFPASWRYVSSAL